MPDYECEHKSTRTERTKSGDVITVKVICNACGTVVSTSTEYT